MSVYSNKDYGKTSQLGKFYVDTSAYCETLTHCFFFCFFFDMLTPKPSAFFFDQAVLVLKPKSKPNSV